MVGLFLGGTCGEGPWMRDRDLEILVRATVEAGAGRLLLAAQVTDNSHGRVLDNIDRVTGWGAQIAVVDSPGWMLNATPERLVTHYREIARHSPLPVGLYDRGLNGPTSLPTAQLAEVLAEPNIVMVKDSSRNLARREAYLRARERRPELVLLDGDEFDCVSYLKAGYDGLLLGGGIFNAPQAYRIIEAIRVGDDARAARLQEKMNHMMLRVFGGPKIECWLTGQKELLVQMGIFETNHSLLKYPLTAECREQIAALVSGLDGLGHAEDLKVRL